MVDFVREAKTARSHEHIGILNVPMSLVLVWLLLEYARPPITLKLPMIASISLLIWWIASGRAIWFLQAKFAAGLLGAMLLSVPLAANQYSAFWVTYTMAINIACIMMGFAFSLDTVARVGFVIGFLRAVFFYVGIFAVTHEGFGP